MTRTLPLTILGGFLGAGKSSWLRHQLHEGALGRAFVIVNEAAAAPVDNLMLTRAAGLEVLAGGCACCDGLAALIGRLRALCDRLATDGAAAIDRIVLETSGLADPAPIAAAVVADPVLGRRLRLDQVIVLADALNAPAQLAAEPLWRAQLAAADRIILTKTDAADGAQAARVAATLAAQFPGAVLSAASLGVPVALPPPGQALALPRPGADPAPIRPVRLAVGQADWVDLSTWLSALLHARGEQIMRIKGVVRTPAGRLLLQSVRRSVQRPEILPDADGPVPEDDVIVLLGRDLDEAAVQRAWRSFCG